MFFPFSSFIDFLNKKLYNIYKLKGKRRKISGKFYAERFGTEYQ